MRKLAVLVCLLLVACTAPGTGVLPGKVADAAASDPVRLTMIGGSSFYGASATGATPPKPVNSIVGLIRAKADAAYGDAGSGLVIPTGATRANPTFDPRFAFAGTITDTSGGFFGGAAWRLEPDASISFTDTAISFDVWTLGGATVTVDGGDAVQLATGVQSVPAGALGEHTLRITGPARLLGVQAVTGAGKLVVDSVAENGRSAKQFAAPESLALLDRLDPDIAVLCLGGNDWITGTPVTDYIGYLSTIVRRIIADGGTPVLHIQPIPSDSLRPNGGTSWDEYRAAVHGLGQQLGVQVIDHAHLWGRDQPAGVAAGKYADAIHPTDAGAHDIANGIWTALNG